MSGLVVQYPQIDPRAPIDLPAYAELMVTGNFSFLRGGSHGDELITCAVALGLNGMGLADRNSFAGVVKPFTALRDLREGKDEDLARLAKRFRYVVGTRLCFADGTPEILAYPIDRAAFGRLSKLLTTGNLRAKKGDCILRFADLLDRVPEHEVITSYVNGVVEMIPAPEDERFTDGQLLIVHIDETNFDRGEETLRALAGRVPGRVWIAAACTYNGDDRARLNRLADLARRVGVPMLAVNDVLYHEPGRRPLQDVITCIREHLTITTAGRRLEKNAARHIKHPAEMARLFREHPEAIAETQRLVGLITFELSQLKYNYPAEILETGETAQQTLERLTWEGATQRYPVSKKWPKGIPYMVKRGVVRELKLIAEMGFAPYFLTVHDIVRFARHEQKILCQGRGSAANSMTCYCLEITEVEPTVSHLVFGRFLSTERHEPPDIDVDFEHERREEVMQYLYKKYTRERCGLTATVVTYRSKGALREVAKVFGLSTDTIEAMNGMSWGWYSLDLSPQRIKELGFDPNEPTLRKTIEIARELMGFPRHLSQHVGGFVITRDQLDFLVPISKAAMEDRTVIEWDKNDIEALEILKVDVLALGMLTCIRRAFDMMHVHYGMDLTLQGILDEEREDKDRRKRGGVALSDRVYAMTHRADTLGVFQIESRAQMSMLPRLRPTEFYDLVIEVAIVRPGPIQGGMVHPYLKRRMGLEKKPTYPNAKLERVLSRTYGVPLFQEQAMQIATEGAGFSAGEADRLRRAMATWKHNGKIDVFRERFMQGMRDNGYDEDFAARCFKQIEGFGEYGFPESHSASFALLVYVSCWLKCHYPDVFACALLNSQPMGFYSPAQIVRDAKEHGVEVHEVDVNLSDWWHVLEPGTPATPRIWDRHSEMREDIRSVHSIRLGLSQVSGLKEDHANIVVARRGAGYTSIRDLWLRTGIPIGSLQKLADADAFNSLGLTRREASWAIRGLIGTDGAETLPLFKSARLPAPRHDTVAGLPEMSPGESVVHDYSSLSLSLKAHPVSFVRTELDKGRTLRCADLEKVRDGTWVEVAGLVLVRQRPGTASGVIFATLEDETGIANIVIWNKVFDANRRVVLTSRMLAVRGKLQTDGRVIHVIAQTFTDLTPMLVKVAQGHQLSSAVLSPADEGREGLPVRGGRDEPKLRHEERVARQARAALPSGRNFH